MIEHLVEHAVIVSAIAPALVLAGPHLVKALPKQERRILVRALHALTRPLLAWPLFVGAMWALNMPAVLEWLETRPLLHIASHGLMLGLAVLFWLPVLGRPRRVQGIAAGAYLLTAGMASDLLGAWYMVTGRTGAGVAMIAGMLPIALAAVVLTWLGLVREERRAVRWEAYADAPR